MRIFCKVLNFHNSHAGAEDTWRAYSDMREANYKNSDKYFHARGNYDAAQRGPGGKWAAELISSPHWPGVVNCGQWELRSAELADAAGAGDMWRAYSDMREANYKNADKYFHARGNYDAAQRGPGGKWAAEVISDAREGWQSDVSGRGAEDTRQDQEANAWGRSGGDPNRYRPEGLPSKY
ncbi:Serum amyloid A protein [Chelonia mydas]|uniref:Serum amyloid A protein n=1 Tax=Chelonia mydas TaxID=8469 RepID=M7BM00_CHEMY|nr:Serum amyloid A protein [Chelonia mydas]